MALKLKFSIDLGSCPPKRVGCRAASLSTTMPERTGRYFVDLRCMYPERMKKAFFRTLSTRLFIELFITLSISEHYDKMVCSILFSSKPNTSKPKTAVHNVIVLAPHPDSATLFNSVRRKQTTLFAQCFKTRIVHKYFIHFDWTQGSYWCYLN